ncbi:MULTISPECIES: alpha/beta hydrolase [Actinomyces]|uniref:Alpha/beta hydrolase n=1 Tax=Actinomyces respiraculi TaxID=2744574 RepID=A0A7T0LJF1_9ACTO|nr:MULTISPECIES: alpha/beta hydrolase [Actinomyces]QPL04755.1 alpha/beta hydrolase [Actinomyces respiraculi]
MSARTHRPRTACRRPGLLVIAAGVGTTAALVNRLHLHRDIAAEVHPDLQVPRLIVPPALALGKPLACTALTALMARAKTRITGRPPAMPAQRTWDPALDLQALTIDSPDSAASAHSARAVRVVVATSAAARDAFAAGRSVPALLWVHGGGHVLGDADADVEVFRLLANELGAVAVAVDYRTAFTAPHPADVDDCWTALTWLLNGGLGAVDPRRIAVVGESAGGGTAASLVQRAVDHGIHLAAQVLIYPMLDDRAATRARHGSAPRTRGRLLWSRSLDRLGWAAYLRGPGGTGPGSARPYAVPGRRTDLSGMPPTWIGVGDLDLFHDDDVAYASRLRESGVACELVVVPGMYHAADRVAPQVPVMQTWRASMIAHLRRYLEPVGRDRT